MNDELLNLIKQFDFFSDDELYKIMGKEIIAFSEKEKYGIGITIGHFFPVMEKSVDMSLIMFGFMLQKIYHSQILREHIYHLCHDILKTQPSFYIKDYNCFKDVLYRLKDVVKEDHYSYKRNRIFFYDTILILWQIDLSESEDLDRYKKCMLMLLNRLIERENKKDIILGKKWFVRMKSNLEELICTNYSVKKYILTSNEDKYALVAAIVGLISCCKEYSNSMIAVFVVLIMRHGIRIYCKAYLPSDNL